MKHNNVIPNIHLHKHWQGFVRTWFNQPARKQRRLQARKSKAARLFPRPLEQLRPVVRQQTIEYNRKVKLGKGFSLAELKAAGLGAAFARSVGVKVDHRRRNKSQESLDLNKRRLQAYLSKLVLFPKKEGVTKKGLVNDSTGDALKTTGQNTDLKLMGTTPFTSQKREKAVKITQEMKNEKVYQKLRLERINKYYKGKRDKKSKDAGNKEN